MKADKRPVLVEQEGDWYETHIEKPIRELVKFLRNNGVNTEDSCGHDMYIQCQYIPGKEDEMKIYNLVYNYLWENKKELTFNIDISIRVKEGHQYPTLNIDLNPYKKIAEREEYYRLKNIFDKRKKLKK